MVHMDAPCARRLELPACEAMLVRKSGALARLDELYIGPGSVEAYPAHILLNEMPNSAHNRVQPFAHVDNGSRAQALRCVGVSAISLAPTSIKVHLSVSQAGAGVVVQMLILL